MAGAPILARRGCGEAVPVVGALFFPAFRPFCCPFSPPPLIGYVTLCHPKCH